MHLGTALEAITPDDVKKIKNKFPDVKVMRTIPVIKESNIEDAKQYDGIADFLLLDTVNKELGCIGVSGKVHDWNISKRLVKAVKIPVILAGGLGPDNVADAIAKVHPAGVDSKTKTDNTGGKGKDLSKVKQFAEQAKLN